MRARGAAASSCELMEVEPYGKAGLMKDSEGDSPEDESFRIARWKYKGHGKQSPE